MSTIPLSALRGALDHTARQVEPDVGNLERALEEEIERGSFALGMMSAAFVMQGLNVVDAVRLYPDVFREFTEKCRNLNPPS